MEKRTELFQLIEACNKVKVKDEFYGHYKQLMGLYIEIYFDNGHLIETREKILEVAKDYQSRFPQYITHYTRHNARRASKFNDQTFDYYQQTMDPEREFENWEVILRYKNNKEYVNTSYHYLSIYAQGVDYYDYNGNMTCYLPIEFLNEQGIEAFINMFKSYCTLLKADQAYAGISLIQNNYDNPPAFPFFKRFKGLDMGSFASGPSLNLRSLNIRSEEPREYMLIKPPSWLTALSERYLSQLGGKESLSPQMVGENKLHDYASGVIIQSMDLPRLMDVNYEQIDKNHINIAKILHPLSVQKIFDGYGFMEVPDGLDDVLEAEAWLNRFVPYFDKLD